MQSFGEKIRQLRLAQKLALRTVAAHLDIDQAILSKFERGQRKPSKEQVMQLATYFKANEQELLLAWLADKVIYSLEGEELALKAIQLAEERVAYARFKLINRKEIIKKIKQVIKTFKPVQKAWIYGSFAREDDGPKSDIDIAIQSTAAFTYFDLAEVQHQLEAILNRKVDIGFIDSFKPHIAKNVNADLKLVYEK